ncbi:MAG: hypothetical protein IJS24_05885 [Eubacterium sp.]|nr:hypothetical protein [Eubacterium sp.]
MRTVDSRYPKPSMTDLPLDLWNSVVDTIMSSPAPDFSKADRKIAELDKCIREEREANERKST